MPDKSPNIVIVAIDSLRADHLGCYGYHKPTSPAIDSLAEESVVFEQAIAAGIPTTPSFTTLFTGLHPYLHRIVTHPAKRRLSRHIRTLPELAKQAGYVTLACDNLVIQGGGAGTWFARGFDHYSGFFYRPFGDQSGQLTDSALELVQERDDQPFFLFIHYWDPHTPYGPLPPYDTMHYEPGSVPVDMADVHALAPEYYDMFVGDMNLARPDDYAYVLAQYDGEISQVDAQVGRLVEGLRGLRVWDDTVFVVVADHGECFGEGDFHFDHHGLYDAVTRVALVIRIPGHGGRRVDQLISTEDVLPTLVDIAGLPLPDIELSGSSAASLVAGAPPASRSRVRNSVISAESTRQASLALRTERYKLIEPIVEDENGRPLPDFYGGPRSPQPLLFDLESDPGERRDLASAQPERLADMTRQLQSWRAEMGRLSGEPDPIRAQGLGLPFDRFMERRSSRRAALREG